MGKDAHSLPLSSTLKQDLQQFVSFIKKLVYAENDELLYLHSPQTSQTGDKPSLFSKDCLRSLIAHFIDQNQNCSVLLWGSWAGWAVPDWGNLVHRWRSAP